MSKLMFETACHFVLVLGGQIERQQVVSAARPQSGDDVVVANLEEVRNI